MTHPPLLEVKDLRTHFFLREGVVRAVDGVSYTIHRGQTLGIIGESGCGKSITAQSILRLVPSPPGRIVGGKILYHLPTDDAATGTVVDLAQLDPRGDEIRQIRGKEISMIFQEPMTSFGPMHTIGNQIVEAIQLHQHGMSQREAVALATDMLAKVGIARPKQTIQAYPHQLSGGMRQRAMIAMALSCKPSLLIADEPTTALDVTIQAQILDLLRRLQAELGMAIIFITHNLGVIAEIADEVAVMYLGRIVEQASVQDLFDHPKHPYTQALLKSVPRVDEKPGARLLTIEGSVPDPFNAPRGCAFSDRCAHFMPGTCDKAMPALIPVAELDSANASARPHLARCFLYSENSEQTTAAPMPATTPVEAVHA